MDLKDFFPRKTLSKVYFYSKELICLLLNLGLFLNMYQVYPSHD